MDNVLLLEKFIVEYETEKRNRKIGYLLLPLIIGFYIIRKSNRKITEINFQITNLENTVLREIKESLNSQIDQSHQLFNRDTYLIYEERKNQNSKILSLKKRISFLLNHSHIYSNKFKQSLQEYVKQCNDLQLELDDYNKKFVQKRIHDYEPLFKKARVPLDLDQKTAIVIDDKHNLIVAGAGSGKTEVLTNRIAYLVNRKPDTIKKERILALAFQNKAADEIKTRLQERYNMNVDVRTFHSLGRQILLKVKSPTEVYGGDNYDVACRKLITSIYEQLKSQTSFQNEIRYLMKYFGDFNEEKTEKDFSNKEQFYTYQRNLRYHTLNGEIVKSLGEQEIYNFFLMHKLNGRRINILYESPADWMSYIDESGNKKVPKPDFFFPEFDMYLEHWSIDSNGDVPPWYESDYKQNMGIKKARFKEQKKYTLIETTFGEYSKNLNFQNILKQRFLSALKTKYPDQDFVLTAIEFNELVETVWEDCKAFIATLSNNLWNFINIAKTHKLTPTDIERRLQNEKWSPFQIAFSKVALHIYNKYQQELRQKKTIDFPDMINLAIDKLTENKELYRDVFDHILIDEYQDISPQRYELIRVLMEKNPRCKLFCVGDDWQSIMGFTGSNLDFFINFEKYFDHPARTDLRTNYRSIKSIVETGQEIIKHNGDAQLKKETLATNSIEKPIKVFSLKHDENFKRQYIEQAADHCQHQITKLLKDGYKPTDIMVLTRIRNPIFTDNFIDFAEKTKIEYTSIHKSKGLQARVIFLVNVDSGLYGFPCELEDSAIFAPARNNKITNREAEERRLFYVAVTRAKEDVFMYTQKCLSSKFLDEIKNRLEIEEVSY